MAAAAATTTTGPAGATGPFSWALARLRREPLSPDLPTGDDLPIAQHIEQLCHRLNHQWRDRLLTPLVTIRLFVLQVLHGNTAITHLPHLAGLSFTSGSYTEARQRLPLQLLQCLMHQMAGWVDCATTTTTSSSSSLLLGQRVLLGDGSSASMPDTPPLRQRFGLPTHQRLGIGYPVARIMGLLDLATGLFIELLALPLFTHDLPNLIKLHRCLRPGDVLLGDRAFCSFAHFCLLNAGGCFGCFRLHQARKVPALGGGIQRWLKPKVPPPWMSVEQYESLPPLLDVRLVHYTIINRGYRTREVWLATTLLDEQQWPDERLINLYGRRWTIETCFAHLKTTLRMDVLKCKTVDGVLKELAVYLIVYNLIRLLMLKAAATTTQPAVAIDRLSFIDTARALAAMLLGLSSGRQKLLINPRRPGRHEPRMIRRRPTQYDLLTQPRAAYREPAAASMRRRKR